MMEQAAVSIPPALLRQVGENLILYFLSFALRLDETSWVIQFHLVTDIFMELICGPLKTKYLAR
jgi:hypothetical protein